MEHIYSFTCRICNKQFQEARDKPYLKPRTTKKCKECKNSRVKEAKVLEGERSEIRCGNYKSFSEYEKLPCHPPEWSEKAFGWGSCTKGRTSDSDALIMQNTLVFEEDCCQEFEE